MSIEICTDCITLPNFSNYYDQLVESKKEFDPSALSLPTMPSPLFSTITNPDIFISNLASQLSVNTFLNFIKAALEPLMTFVGAALDSLPKVPILNLSLDDLINGFDIDSLVEKYKSTDLSAPLLPDPLLPTASIPEYDVVQKIQSLINTYCGNLITFATGIIDSVIDKLSKKPFNFTATFPELPELPTSFGDLMESAYAKIGAFSLDDMVEKYKSSGESSLPSLSSLFMGLGFPGLPNLNFAIPDPMFEEVSMPELEIAEIAKNYYMALVNACGAYIEQFCDLVKNFISFSFPTICVPIPSYSLSSVNVPNIINN